MNRKVQAILQCSKEYIPDVSGICMNGTTNYCYIVSSNEYYNNKIIVSYNGIDWNTITISSLDNNIIYHWNAICWSPELDNNYLCAVGNNGNVITSTNGINWQLNKIGTGTVNYEMVYWSATEHQYYALNTEIKKKAVSINGSSWTETDLTDDEILTINKLHFTSAWNVATAVNDIATDKISYNGTGNTTDAAQWFDEIQGPFAVVNNEVGAPQTDYIILNYSAENKLFNVIYPTDNKRGINVSVNTISDITSFEVAYSLSDLNLTSAVYSDVLDTVYAVDTSNKCWYSSTMYDWRSVSNVGLSDIVNDMQYVKDINTIFAIAGNGDNSISSNTITWNRGTAIQSGETTLIPKWNKLCWSPLYSKMLAVSVNEYPYVATTYDGRSYDLVPFDAAFSSYAIIDVIWSEILDKYVAITSNNRIIVSDDGTNWVPKSEIANSFGRLSSITESTILGKIIIATGNRLCLFSSSDAEIWDPIGLPETDDWYNCIHVSAKGVIAVYGYEKILYTADLMNWEVTSHNYTFGLPLKVIEIKNLNRCIIVDTSTYTTYTMTLGASADTGATLNNRPKWIKARYLLNDKLNIIPNPDFTVDKSEWNVVTTAPTDIIDTSITYDNILETGMMKVTVHTSRVQGNTSNNVGIETNWLKIDADTEYNCNVLASASTQNCYVYVYGRGTDGEDVLLKMSSNLSTANEKTVSLDFVSRQFTYVKLAIKFTQASFDDYFQFTNARLYPKTAELIDDTMFKNHASVYNYDIACNSIVNTSAIKLLGTDDSYIELKQPYVDNDSITISLWARFDNLSFVGHKAILYSGTEDSNLKIYIDDVNHNLNVELLKEIYDSGFKVEEDKWYHIAVTYDLTRLSIYVNGDRVNTYEKILTDFENIQYNDSSYYTRFGTITPKDTTDYIVSQWDGKTITTNWYTNSTSNNYVINSAADLAGLARIVNTGIYDFAECIVSLKININLNNYLWTPIGINTNNISRPFRGIFNGNNYEISGLKISLDDNTYVEDSINSAGLFGYISGVGTTQTCTITSLKVYGDCKSTLDPLKYTDINSNRFNIAGIVAYGRNFKISDCIYSGNIDSVYCGAGVIARAETAEIYNCINNATVYVSGGSASGVITHLTDGKAINCSNTGNIQLASNISGGSASGVIAHFYGNAVADYYFEISNCVNEGEISASNIDGAVLTNTSAGIVGTINNSTTELRIQGCQNYGLIKGVMDTAGIVGRINANSSSQLAIYESFNIGEVYDMVEFSGMLTDLIPSSIRNIGGIIAYIGINNTQYINIHGCINNGSIHKAENAGGIVGINFNRLNIYNCYNNGRVYDAYNAAGILGNMNGFCSINNCLNTGLIATIYSQAPTYIGAMLGKTASVGNIQESKNNIYLETSLTYAANIFDSLLNTLSKTHKELVDVNILYILNGGINSTAKFKYVMDYTDDIVKFLNLAGKFPIPEELLVLLQDVVNEKIYAISNYVSLACTLVDIQFYDFALSHKIIRELSRAKILHYKCAHKAETNINFIPTENGTFKNLIATTGGESYNLPVISKMLDDSNKYGDDVYKVTFIQKSKASDDNAIREHVTTENFEIDTITSDYTFSLYIKNDNIDHNYDKLRFMFIIDDDMTNYYTVRPKATTETMGNDLLGGLYTRYVISLGQMFKPGSNVRIVIALNASEYLGIDNNVLDSDFTIYLAAPQLENKNIVSEYIQGRVIGILRDVSGYAKNTELPIATCPTYSSVENAYVFNPYKNIIIPSKYTKPSNQFTIALWYKIPDKFGDNDNQLVPKSIVSRSNDFFSNGKGWLIGVNGSYGNDIVFQVKTETKTKDVRFYVSTSTVMSWTQLVAVYDNGNVYTYVNGKQSSSNTESFNIEHLITDIVIGSNFTNIEGINNMQGDMIRDFRLYDTAFTDADVLELYQGSGIVDTLGLLHSFAFRTIDNDNPDFVISKKNLTAKDWHISDLISNTVNFWPMWGTSKNYSDNRDNILYVNDIEVTKGIKNLRCFRFDGVSSYAYSKYSVGFSDIPSSTITFWIKVDEADTADVCLLELSQNAYQNNAFSIYLTTDGKITYNDYGVNNIAPTNVTTLTAINDNSWHYIAVEIIRCKSVTIFIDNVKDVQLSNYAALTASSNTSAPENIWYNEYTYNTPINSIFIANNNINVNRMSEKNSFWRYPINGDNTGAIKIDDILNSQSAYINQMEYYNGSVYFTIHDYNYGISYLFGINTANGVKTVLATSYYCSAMKIKDNAIYITDRDSVLTENISYTGYKCNYIKNNGITLPYYNYYIVSISKIYDNIKTYSPDLYVLNDTEIVWKTADRPNGEYNVDFVYNKVEYTTYYVKSIDINNNSLVVKYPTNHNNIITGIDVDNMNNVYTSSKDCTVKMTIPAKNIWSIEYDSWVNDVKVTSSQQSIIVALRDKTLRRISISGEELWVYPFANNAEAIKLASYNNALYCILTNSVYTDDIESDEGRQIWSSTANAIAKMDGIGNTIWTQELPAPATSITFAEGTNNMFTAGTDGVIHRINEITVLPYSNYQLYIGSHAGKTSFFRGLIQDIKIYNKILTPNELDIQYNLYDQRINKPVQIDSDNAVYVYQDIYELN